MDYVQHTPERIRNSYNLVFEKSIEQNVSDIQPTTPDVSNDHYKKMATKKYLDGEIDVDTLHSILNNIEEKSDTKKQPPDPSYQ